jgi:tRNA(fMet)-specific endonuclease VapC
MRACLDTNAYSMLMRGRADLQRSLEEAESVHVPTVVLGELFAGFFMGTRCAENCHDLEAFLDLPGVEVAPTTKEIAERYGYLLRDLRKQGTPIPTNDLWIAATALESGARLISYDDHFKQVAGLIVSSP